MTDKESKSDSDDDVCFLYDIETPPTWIERVFGEPHHVFDKYPGHQISWKFVITLSFVYFVEGSEDWFVIAARYYATSMFDLGPAEWSNLRSKLTLPWTVKIIYGLMIDTLPILGYKRKSYMLIFGLLAPLSAFIAIAFATHLYVQLTCMLVNMLAVAWCDVIADAMTVERTEFKSNTVATRLQSLAWSSRYIASIAGMLIAARIELSGKPKDMLIVYWMYFFVCCSLIICAIILPEKRVMSKNKNEIMNHEMELVSDKSDDVNGMDNKQTYAVKKIVYLVWETICRKSVFYALLFTFVLRCTPTSEESLDYFLIYELGFSSVWIGYLSIAGGVAFLISIAIITYQSRASNHKFSLRKLYIIWTLIGSILPFMTLILVFRLNEGILPNVYFMLSDKIIVSTALDILQMAINVLYARICPPGIEGVFMTVLTSISNIGLFICLQISSAITKLLGIECNEDPNDADSVQCDFKNLWLLIVIVNLSTLIPLILIKKVPNEEELQHIGDELKKVSMDQNENESYAELNRSKMIKPFWIMMDYAVPFFKNNLCCCLCKNDDQRLEDEKQLELIVNATASNPSLIQNNNYSEIEMR